MSKFDYSKKHLYNNAKPTQGYVTVPFVVENRKNFIEMGVDANNIETYHNANGKKFLVSFTEVPEVEFDDYMKFFNTEVGAFFDEYGEISYKEKYTRCTITDSKGRAKVCSVHNHCCNCTRKDPCGKLYRDLKTSGMVSLDPMIEDGSFDPPALESDVFIGILYDELLEAAGKVEKLYAEVIKMRVEGKERPEIINNLPCGHTKGYNVFKEAVAFADEFLKK